MTRLALLCDRILEAGWLAALVSVPLYFNIYSSRVFEPDKLVVLRSIVLLMCFAYIVRFLETYASGVDRGRDAPAEGTAETPRRSISPLAALRAANPLALPALGLAAVYIISSFLSIVPATSFWGSYQRLQGAYSYLTYIALFFFIAQNLKTKPQVDRFVKIALLTSLPISLYGITQHFQLDPLPWGGDVTFRVASTMGNAIFVAAYLIMVVPLALARLVDSVRKLRRRTGPEPLAGGRHILGLIGLLIFQNVALALFIKFAVSSPNLWWGALPIVGLFLASSLAFVGPQPGRDGSPSRLSLIAEVFGYATLLVLQLLTILLSQSRGPEIGLGVGIVAFVILLAIRSGSKRTLFASSAAAGIVAALVLVMNLPGTPLAPLKKVPYLGRLGQFDQLSSGTGEVRVLIWEGDLKLLSTYPSIGFSPDRLRFLRPLVGYGPEALYVAYNKVYPPDLAHYEARNASPDRSHQDTLDYLTMTGILGTIAFFFVLGVGLSLTWRAARRSRDPSTQLLLLAIIGAVVAHFVETQVAIAIASTLTYMWALFGLAVAVRGMQRGAERAGEAQFAPVLASGAGSLKATAGEAVAALPAGGKAADSRPTSVGPKPQEIRTESRTKSKNKGKAKGRSPAAPARRESGRSLLPRELDNLSYVIAYVLLTGMGLLWLAKYNASADVLVAYVAGFAWLALGIVAVAFSLGALPRLAFWRHANWWVYLPLVILTLVLVQMNLNLVIADTYYKRGFSFDSQSRWDQAIPAYQEALQLTPNQDFYYLFLGRAYLELAKVDTRPNINPPLVVTAEVARDITYAELSKLGKGDMLQLSQAALEKARALNPLNTDHYANLARLYRYWADLGDRTKLDLSSAYYAKATTLSPDSAQLWAEWAEIYLAKGSPTDAVAKATKGIQLDPIYAPNFLYLGDAYLAENKIQDALKADLKVLQIDPTVLTDARFETRVTAYQKANLLDKLGAAYGTAAQTDKWRNSAVVHSAYGYILTLLGKTPDATQEFRTWVKLSPNDWLAHRNLALIYRSQGMFDQAVAEGTQAENLAPADQKSAMQSWISETLKAKK